MEPVAIVTLVLATLIIGGLIVAYGMRVVAPAAAPWLAGLFIAFQTVPTAAVILEGYTGLIYCQEILAGLALLMILTARASFASAIDHLLRASAALEESDATTTI